MTDETREQIRKDAAKFFRQTVSCGVTHAFAQGATHQHPIAEKAGYNLGLEDALKLIDQYYYGMTKDQWQDLTRKIEALKR